MRKKKIYAIYKGEKFLFEGTAKECAEAENKAKYNERIIMRWLEDMKLTEDTCTNTEKDMTDAFIDYCKMSYAPDEFIEVLENLE